MAELPIQLPHTLVIHSARQALDQLSPLIAQHVGAEIHLDASALTQFDSAALAVLLECSRLARGAGKVFLINHAPSKLIALAALYGLSELLPMVAAVETDTASELVR